MGLRLSSRGSRRVNHAGGILALGSESERRNATIRLLAARNYGTMPTVETGRCDGERVRLYRWTDAPAGDLIGLGEGERVNLALLTGPTYPARFLPGEDVIDLKPGEWTVAPPTPPESDEAEPLYLPPIYRLPVATVDRLLNKIEPVFERGVGHERLRASQTRAREAGLLTDEVADEIIERVTFMLTPKADRVVPPAVEAGRPKVATDPPPR